MTSTQLGLSRGRRIGSKPAFGRRGLRTISLRRRGDINGRQPKLTHTKALTIQTTIFDQRAYDAGLRDAMRTVIDEFTLTHPGIRNVQREYFYAVHE